MKMLGIAKKRKYDDFKEAFDRASQVVLGIKENSLKQGIKEVCGLASRRVEERKRRCWRAKRVFYGNTSSKLQSGRKT
jgi:hypothetical protein